MIKRGKAQEGLTTDTPNPASFRDPDGFLFSRNGQLYRQINLSAQADYDLFIESGLCQELTQKGWLIPHRELDIPFPEPEEGYKVIQPEVIPFISYPYEWCFSQLKDAALLTLQIQNFGIKFI